MKHNVDTESILHTQQQMRVGFQTIGMFVIMGVLVYSVIRWSSKHINQIPTPLESFVSSRVPPDTKVLMSIYKVDWCPHCQRLKPSVDTLQARLADRPVSGFQLEVVDCEKNPKTCRDAGVKSYPTILVTRPGRPVADPLPVSVDRQDPDAMYRYIRSLVA